MKKMNRFMISMLIAATLYGSLASAASPDVSRQDISGSVYDSDIYNTVVSYVDTYFPYLEEENRDEMIAALYAEKAEGLSASGTLAAAENNGISIYNGNSEEAFSAVTASFQRIEEEEDYIVFLISSFPSVTYQASISTWEENLDFLKSNYDAIVSEPGINRAYVDSYIQAYEEVSSTRDYGDTKICTLSSVTTDSNYSISAATTYAKTYYATPNSDYAYFDEGDCANFVSQCLYAGGKTSTGSWYYTSSSDYSSSWTIANSFVTYWKSAALTYETFSTSEIADAAAVAYRGDAIGFLNSNGRGVHIMLVYSYADEDLVLAGHTKSTISTLLSDEASYSGYASFIVFGMKYS